MHPRNLFAEWDDDEGYDESLSDGADDASLLEIRYALHANALAEALEKTAAEGELALAQVDVLHLNEQDERELVRSEAEEHAAVDGEVRALLASGQRADAALAREQLEAEVMMLQHELHYYETIRRQDECEFLRADELASISITDGEYTLGCWRQEPRPEREDNDSSLLQLTSQVNLVHRELLQMQDMAELNAFESEQRDSQCHRAERELASLVAALRRRLASVLAHTMALNSEAAHLRISMIEEERVAASLHLQHALRSQRLDMEKLFRAATQQAATQRASREAYAREQEHRAAARGSTRSVVMTAELGRIAAEGAFYA
ncbi:hypothetical protein T492DRAFT_1120556 [Pavlovales sp. CCMP2436]|nr:hypothetical protein T492DRAFT_1120556 [Pavlovales sp. CCMP2436]